MKVLKERIGNAEVYIQTLDEDLDELGKPATQRRTQTTSSASDLRAAYKKVRSVVRDIAVDFGSELNTLGGVVSPSAVEMEFSLALSAEGKVVWLISGKGEFGLKINITWNLTGDDSAAKTIHG